MNLQEIMDQTSTLAGSSINIKSVKRYVNEAMRILATNFDSACIKDSFTIDCDNTNREYEIPLNSLGILKVEDEYGNKTKDYLADFNLISFSRKGIYTIKYLRAAKDIENKPSTFMLAKEVPEINIAYHTCLPYFVASKYLMANEKDLNKNDKSSFYIQQFMEISEKTNSKLSKMKRRNKQIKAPFWR